jgi:hypothetical protein
MSVSSHEQSFRHSKSSCRLIVQVFGLPREGEEWCPKPLLPAFPTFLDAPECGRRRQTGRRVEMWASAVERPPIPGEGY